MSELANSNALLKRATLQDGLTKYLKLKNFSIQNQLLLNLLNTTISFYKEELQITKIPNYAMINKILEIKKVKDKTMHLVKWMGWADKYNSWEEDSEVQNIDTK